MTRRIPLADWDACTPRPHACGLCAGRPLVPVTQLPEADLEPLEEELETALLKHFASVKHKREKSERNQRKYAARERMQEDEEKTKQRREMEFDKNWNKQERMEGRMDSWLEFAKEPKKVKVNANFKTEVREDTKFGQVKANEWRKRWK